MNASQYRMQRDALIAAMQRALHWLNTVENMDVVRTARSELIAALQTARKTK
jgi:hypothetical protein